MNRREAMFGLAAMGTSLLLPRLVKAEGTNFEYRSSPLTPKELEQQTLDAADRLIAGFWENEEIRKLYLTHHFPEAQTKDDVREILRKSARIEIPAPPECAKVLERSNYRDGTTNKSAINDLAKAMSLGKYGLYIDGDTQRLYVLKKTSEKTVEFVSSITVSTSQDPFSNELHSGGTPVGMHRVGKGQDISVEGILAESVSVRNLHKNIFKEVQFPGETKKRTVALGMAGRDALPEMTTARLLAISNFTQPARAANLHGTNYENELGTRASGGCARMSNVAIKYLFGTDKDGVPYVENGTVVVNKETNQWEIRGGTPLMIFATEAVPILTRRNPIGKQNQNTVVQRPLKPASKKAVKETLRPIERKPAEKNQKEPDGYWEDVTGKI